MNKIQAKKLANEHTFSLYELRQILIDARADFKDWQKPSHTNPHLSYGTAFNLFAKTIKAKLNSKSPGLMRPLTVNILCLFGKYSKIQLEKKPKIDVYTHHEDPIEIDF
jgi:hypothetical protein